MTQPTITVYSKPSCVQCNATYRRLDAAGLDYPIVDISEDADALAYVKSLGYLEAPVVVTDEKHWSGYNPGEIDAFLARLAPEKEIA